MVQRTCPLCWTELPAGELNLADGVALCRSCFERWQQDPAPVVDSGDGQPPKGCAVRNDVEQLRVVARASSLESAVRLFFAALLCNGANVAIVAVAIAATHGYSSGALPAWFPFTSINDTGSPSLGLVLFIWVLALPFLATGLQLTVMLLTVLFGRCEVRLRGPQGVIFTGFGPIGWRRRFDASAVDAVGIARPFWSSPHDQQACIMIRTKRKYLLGYVLPEVRREWMRTTLDELLVDDRVDGTDQLAAR